MSIARHHNEWLSLLEISGPFLSMPVLLRVFPQGIDALDREQSMEVRQAYEEWLDNQGGLKPDPAIHAVWVRYVFERLLGFEKSRLLKGPAIPAHLEAVVAEQGETLRPDLVITADDETPRLLVNVVPHSQTLEKRLQDRRWKASLADRTIELLRATGVPLGLLTNGEQWMLVHAPRGETTTFVSWYASLWFEEPLTQRAFTSLLGAGRFFGAADENTLEGMFKASADQQQEVTDQLGYQVRRAVEVLIRSLDKADQGTGRRLLGSIGESELYEAALTVMMRLVFLFSAEERELLLLGDPIYDQNYAVSTLRAQLRETADQQGEEVLEWRFDAWCRLIAAFRLVHQGIQHDRLNLPAYGGSLFDPQKYPFLEGRSHLSLEEGSEVRAEPLPISNRTVLHLLDSLQILQVKVSGGGGRGAQAGYSEARRLSFRALDVEQIGHVYEGLLDHVAVRAGEIVLGLSGTKDREPEIPISELNLRSEKGEDELVKYLNEQTGRSESALRRALHAELDAFALGRLMIACNTDDSACRQVLPYAGLLRLDDFGYPTVFLTGSLYVTAGATRRATGTHYTPRSLTEPIVQHTLEPLVYIGPAEGLPKEQWKLRSPAELLDLKVCDMAMGSAGFLVQVIRYLSERLVEAWESLTPGPSPGSGEGRFIQITPEGKPATGSPGETIIPRDDEERLILARRLVADRCIYGVDKNPLAVEIAKLSIWLTTMDKGRPFTFLDHALKCGDSLVGASANEYLRWAHGWGAAEAPLFDEELERELDAARKKRRELETFQVLDVHDAEHKSELLKEADQALEHIKRGCDLLTGARLLGLREKEVEELQVGLLKAYIAGQEETSELARLPLVSVRNERAFHWEFEFPEVFEKGGFSAFLGNPPFIGGRRIRETLGDSYRETLYQLYPNSSGNADYCAFFFFQGYSLLRKGGSLGFIATNTIAQGDTRKTGLDRIVNLGGTIYHAINSQSWIGQAAVVVSILHIAKRLIKPPFVLDGKPASYISPSLKNRKAIGNPKSLIANQNISYQGSVVVGLGFILTPEEANIIKTLNSHNADVIFPYLNGEDLNTHPEQKPSRFAINFFDWPLEKSEKYSEPMAIIREKVYPVRLKVNREAHRKYWWHYGDKRPALYQAIAPLRNVLVIARVTKYVAFVFVPNGWIYNEKTFVLPTEDYSNFAALQNTFHDVWSWNYSSTLGSGTLNYAPTDCLVNYPFPSNSFSNSLQLIGEIYHEHRRQVMLTSHEGMTATYNRFHNLKEKSYDITHLRELHVEMDNTVAAAYGWGDFDLGHGFHETPQGMRYTISEEARREVLSRLLKLNHERYEEEVKEGLHEKKKVKVGKVKPRGEAVKEGNGQYELF